MKLSNQQQWRLNLGQQQHLLQLSFIAFCTGIVVSSDYFISCDYGQRWLTGSDGSENEQLSSLSIVMPRLGALCMPVLCIFCNDKGKTGIPFVLNAIAKQKSNSLGNTVLQFVVAAIALISGQSVGKEGPAVHLAPAAPRYWLNPFI